MRKLILTLSIMSLPLAACGQEKKTPPPTPEQHVGQGPITVQEEEEEDLPAKPGEDEATAPAGDKKSTG